MEQVRDSKEFNADIRVLADAELDAVDGGGGTQTAGGGNTSLWGKIKSLMFGVDASFYD